MDSTEEIEINNESFELNENEENTKNEEDEEDEEWIIPDIINLESEIEVAEVIEKSKKRKKKYSNINKCHNFQEDPTWKEKNKLV